MSSVRFGVSIYEVYVSGTTVQNLTSLSLFSHLTLQVFFRHLSELVLNIMLVLILSFTNSEVVLTPTLLYNLWHL